MIIFVSFFVCGEFYRMTIGGMGFVSLDSIAAFPVLFFYLAIFGMIILPLTNLVSAFSSARRMRMH